MNSTDAQYQLDLSPAGMPSVRGEISFRNAAKVYRDVPMPSKALQGGGSAPIPGTIVNFDIGALTGADSATLALLIAWSAHVRKAGGTLHYLNTPDALRKLARLSDVEQLLGFAPSSEKGERE